MDVLERFSLNAKHNVNIVGDASVLKQVVEYFSHHVELGRRGVSIRYITEITKDNLAVCNSLMEWVDLRHLDNLKGNFSVSEQEFVATSITFAESQVPQIIHSKVRAMVEQHQYIFETLWTKATPADRKIREIEHGIAPTITEVITSPEESFTRANELMRSAGNEVLVIFTSPNASPSIFSIAGLGLCRQIVDRGAKLRMLLADDNKSRLADEIKDAVPQAKLRSIQRESQAGISAILVDNKEIMLWEMRNDSTEDPYSAYGVATYSNSESIVLAFRDMFDSLWRQKELYERHEAHDILQREFINVASHELRTPVQPLLGISEIME